MNKTERRNWIVKRSLLVLFDVFAAVFSYFITLVVRFYVNGEFRAIALDRYLPAFWRFIPWYAVLTVLIFFVFRLYNSRWRHAGLHDLNRILLANLVTAAVQVAGTLLFVQRMPVTYYVIGAVIQTVLIILSRFSYRILVAESAHLRKNNLNVMIVGIGETGQILRRQIENNNIAKPVVIFAYNDRSENGMLDGIPVVNDLEKIPEYIKKYQVQCVILADSILPSEVREKIRLQCEGTEIQDFSGYLQNEGPGLTPAKVLEYTGGGVIIAADGAENSFNNAEQALMALHGKYNVDRISAEGDALRLELSPVKLNDLSKAWVKATEKETGEEISFF